MDLLSQITLSFDCDYAPRKLVGSGVLKLSDLEQNRFLNEIIELTTPNLIMSIQKTRDEGDQYVIEFPTGNKVTCDIILRNLYNFMRTTNEQGNKIYETWSSDEYPYLLKGINECTDGSFHVWFNGSWNGSM